MTHIRKTTQSTVLVTEMRRLEDITEKEKKNPIFFEFKVE